MAVLVSIVYKPQDGPPPVNAYVRVPLMEARLVVGYGIEGDVKGGGKRQLNILSAETLEALAGDGFLTAPGQMGEQLVVSGVIVDALPSGALLQIGETACVEIVKPRVGCERFEKYQGKPLEVAAGRMGVLARVLRGGVIRVGDAVRRLVAESAPS